MCGAAPIADSRLWTRARCSISWAATCDTCVRQRRTASSSVPLSPSCSLCFTENAANRYWHMMPCSNSAASHSM